MTIRKMIYQLVRLDGRHRTSWWRGISGAPCYHCDTDRVLTIQVAETDTRGSSKLQSILLPTDGIAHLSGARTRLTSFEIRHSTLKTVSVTWSLHRTANATSGMPHFCASSGSTSGNIGGIIYCSSRVSRPHTFGKRSCDTCTSLSESPIDCSRCETSTEPELLFT